MAKKDQKPPQKDTDVEKNKQVAALSYVFILFIIPLLTKRDSKFSQFHAKQGLVLFVIEILGSLIFWFPVFGQILMLGLLLVSIIGILKTLNGEWWEIPFIYQWSKKVKI